MASPTKQQTGFQSLTKDFLRFWMVDIHLEDHCQKSASQNRHKAHPTSTPRNWGWDHGGDKVQRRGQLRRGRSSSSWLPELCGRGRHKTQAQPSLCFCWVPRNLNLSCLGLGSARNSGPTPWRAAWSLSRVDEGRTHTATGRKSSVVGTLWVLPTHASDICLQCPPSPQHDWTSKPKQETTFARLCQGGY